MRGRDGPARRGGLPVIGMSTADDRPSLLARLGVRSIEPAAFCRSEAERFRILAEYFLDADLQNLLGEVADRFELMAAARQGKK